MSEGRLQEDICVLTKEAVQFWVRRGVMQRNGQDGSWSSDMIVEVTNLDGIQLFVRA